MRRVASCLIVSCALFVVGCSGDNETAESSSGGSHASGGAHSGGAGGAGGSSGVGSTGGTSFGGSGGSSGAAGNASGAQGGSGGASGTPASVYWTEDWEGTGEEVAKRWSETSCENPSAWPDNDPLATNSSPARTSSYAYSGVYALQYHFTGLQPDHGGCYSSRHFPASDEIWMRWYERWGSGMQTAGGEVSAGGIGGAGTKRHYMYDAFGYHGHTFVYMWGSRQLSFAVQAVFDAKEGQWGTETLYQNATPFEMPVDQWVCYEAHLKYNTPGQADGVYEGFATNMTIGGSTVQFANYQGRQWRGQSADDPTPPTANWGTWKVYTQDGLGDIYDDLYAVGPERIGCSSAP